MREPPADPQLAEFKDVHQDSDGMWTARHIPSGRPAAGETWADIEASALVIRVVEALKRSWS